MTATHVVGTGLTSLTLLAERSLRPTIVLSDGTVVERAEVRREVDRRKHDLESARKALVLLVTDRGLAGLSTYLAALELGHCLILVEQPVEGEVEQLEGCYRPDIVVASGPALPWSTLGDRFHSVETDGVRVARRRDVQDGQTLHPELALLLQTSGSLGGPKAVRLSYANLKSNAESIVERLDLRESDRGATTVPIDHSYGLSVVNTHLMAGASLVLDELSLTSQRLWSLVERNAVTNLAGVALSYQLLSRRGWTAAEHSTLRLVCQAGGAMEPDLVSSLASQMLAVGGGLAVMYGQTEATARIATLAPELAVDHPSSVGTAVPGGRVWIEGSDGPAEEGQVGEISYAGPNVMLGYAADRRDLATGDVCHGELRTGDIGFIADELLHVSGRRDRMVKLAGQRINLEQLDRLLGGPDRSCVSVPDGHDRVVVFYEGDADGLDAKRRAATRRMRLPPRAIRTEAVASIPRSRSGKPLLAALASYVAPRGPND